MNVALLGHGRAGKIHYNNLISNKSVNLKYIYDIQTSHIVLNNNNIKITSKIEDILEKDVDFVIICTPTYTHYELIIKCLNSGKHVMCEKPLADKKEEIKHCYECARKNNKVLLCCLNRRFDNNIQKLKKDYNDKIIGNAHIINTISRDFPYPKYDYLKISSGIFHDCAIHDIDFINFILDDKPISVYATGNKIKDENQNANTLDNAFIILEYRNKLIANIYCSRISNNYDQRIEIFGEKGTLLSKNPYLDDKNPISFPERYNYSYKEELKHFVNVINNKEKIIISEEDCLNCYDILEACEKSFEKLKKISIIYGDKKRDYSNVQKEIRLNYFNARKYQTLDFVKNMHKKYLTFTRKMDIFDIFDKLSSFVDVSDPDISLPNFYHGIQTAEGMRKDNLPEWLILVGLIHDIGKIIYLWGENKDGTTIKNQWAIVGDTFIVGCALPEKIIFPEFNKENNDITNPIYNSKYGIYKPNCGLDNVYCSWGHDEYLYQVLKHNKCNLPEEAFYIIRFHSLYSYHKHDEYKHLTNDKDKRLLRYLKLFNKYDLYTKSDDTEITLETKNYYKKLVNKYLNNGVLFF